MSPEKSALVVKKFLTTSRPRAKFLLHQLFFIVPEKRNHENSHVSVKTELVILSGEPMRGQERYKCIGFFFVNICAIFFFPVDSTNKYLYRWDDEKRVFVTVVYYKRGFFFSLLHHILDPREGLLYGPRGVHAASLLGKLQNRHVTQRTHLPHLQPLNEAPETKTKQLGDQWVGESEGVQIITTY